jgi:hypothetical protein
MKGFGGPLFSNIHSFYRQKVLMAFLKVQTTIILRRAIVVIGEVFFRLGVLQSLSPISLHNLLHAIGDGFRS